MNAEFEKRREIAKQNLLTADFSKDLYAGRAAFCLACGVNVEQAEAQLQFTAEWFEHPHPNGRDHRGEADFAAIRMVGVLYHSYDKLSEACRAALDRFFLERDYSSIYGSENHSMMYRVSRMLAAQFYRGRTFQQYGMSAEAVLAEDMAYLDDFLMYRARRAWGEFDSLGYAGEIMVILHVLYSYTQDARMKKKAAMMMDLILLDMIVDSKNGIYGGAHGRIYESAALDATQSSMYRFHCYYFGASGGYPEIPLVDSVAVLSDYYPSEIVCKVEKNRKYPYENRERKHLHCCDAWITGIDWEMLAQVEDLAIDKYIYVSDDYMLGSVLHQDKYPETVACGAYAHHQQHEWELTLPGDGRAKIFSHHPGDPGYHHIHNHWTGDWDCRCGTHFCTKDTAISLYNIEKETEYPYINADIPLEFFDEKILEERSIFLRHRNTYIFVWFSEGYHFVTEGDTAGFEAISDGRKHAFVCHVATGDSFASLEAFADAMRKETMCFNRETMEMECFGIHVDYQKKCVNGEEVQHPFAMLYDCPYLKSVYGSGVIHVTDGEESAVLDFNF